MNFAQGTKRRAMQDRAIVPMINVVFLLLVFFLMTASLTPPAPFEIDPVEAEGVLTDPPPDTLHIAADGRLAYEAARGDAVFATLANRDADRPLPIRADSGLPASELAALLPRLAEIGIADIRLVTVQP